MELTDHEALSRGFSAAAGSAVGGSSSWKCLLVWTWGASARSSPRFAHHRHPTQHSCLRDNSAFFLANPEVEQIAGAPVLLSVYRRTFGNPVQTARDLLEELLACFPSRPKIAGFA